MSLHDTWIQMSPQARRRWKTGGLVALVIGGVLAIGMCAPKPSCGGCGGCSTDRQEAPRNGQILYETRDGAIQNVGGAETYRPRLPNGQLGGVYGFPREPYLPHRDVGGYYTRPHVDRADPSAVITVTDANTGRSRVVSQPGNPIRPQ